MSLWEFTEGQDKATVHDQDSLRAFKCASLFGWNGLEALEDAMKDMEWTGTESAKVSIAHIPRIDNKKYDHKMHSDLSKISTPVLNKSDVPIEPVSRQKSVHSMTGAGLVGASMIKICGAG